MTKQQNEIALADATFNYDSLIALSKLPSTPEHYQGKPREMWAATVQGRELGIGPLTAINNIDLIKGTISMRAKLMSALIHNNGHIIKTLEQTAEVCRLECWRYHAQTNQLIMVGVVTWDIDDATRAKKINESTYKKHPKAMLTNRALTLAARTFYGDCLAGIGYTADEVEITEEVDPIPDGLVLDEDDPEEAHAEEYEEVEEVDDDRYDS
jgi:hypothetical protein